MIGHTKFSDFDAPAKITKFFLVAAINSSVKVLLAISRTLFLCEISGFLRASHK